MKKIITICCSASFYKQAIECEGKLKELGFEVLLPLGAERLRDENFDPEAHKASYNKNEDWHIKQDLMDKHFQKVLHADAILVVNHEKNGLDGYIGGNTLMEITLAYHYKKPIYILNPVSRESNVYEEVMGLHPSFLNGDLEKI